MLQNLYGEPIHNCRIDLDDNRGSWDNSSGTCNEIGGGVHQICATLQSEFSAHTGQSDWSKARAGKPHCLCLGAFALHTSKHRLNKGPKKQLDVHCRAIPQNALSAGYVNKWATWNGHELPDQIVHGVDALVRTCATQTSSPQHREHLQKLTCGLIQHQDFPASSRNHAVIQKLHADMCKASK